MKIKREWQDEPEVFEAVADALLAAGDDSPVHISAWNEEGSYGDRGTITVRLGGRQFQIDLHEIL